MVLRRSLASLVPRRPGGGSGRCRRGVCRRLRHRFSSFCCLWWTGTFRSSSNEEDLFRQGNRLFTVRLHFWQMLAGKQSSLPKYDRLVQVNHSVEDPLGIRYRVLESHDLWWCHHEPEGSAHSSASFQDSRRMRADSILANSPMRT